MQIFELKRSGKNDVTVFMNGERIAAFAAYYGWAICRYLRSNPKFKKMTIDEIRKEVIA